MLTIQIMSIAEMKTKSAPAVVAARENFPRTRNPALGKTPYSKATA
jgi:hypothetical protein